MWLINVETFELEYFLNEVRPSYAILSHTWSAKETTFDKVTGSIEAAKDDPKISNTCRIAKQNGIKYVWIDTCCIDKRSSAELSEAINSMYIWYQDAFVCYVYLEDMARALSIEDCIRDCRWRTRGWTLQEMIAPRDVEFFDAEWQYRGNKIELRETLAKYTRIPRDILAGNKSVTFYEAASKMAWASERRTSRTEDLAYCLMGLFDVNMPLMYGEGKKAFQRLQQEILRQTSDISLLLWHGWTNQGDNFAKPAIKSIENDCKQRSRPTVPNDLFLRQKFFLLPVFAESPGDFSIANGDHPLVMDESIDVSITQKGLVIQNDNSKIEIAEFGSATTTDPMQYWLNVRGIMNNNTGQVWLPLRKIAPFTFAIEYGREYNPSRRSLYSRSNLSKICLILKPSTHTISRAIEVRQHGIRISTQLMPGFCISQIRPHSHWDLEDRIFFIEDRGRHATFAILLHRISKADGERFLILCNPGLPLDRCCKVAKVSRSADLTADSECNPVLVEEIMGTLADSAISWDLLVSRWPEILKWTDTSWYRTRSAEKYRQTWSAKLQPAYFQSFGMTISILNMTLDLAQ